MTNLSHKQTHPMLGNNGSTHHRCRSSLAASRVLGPHNLSDFGLKRPSMLARQRGLTLWPEIHVVALFAMGSHCLQWICIACNGLELLAMDLHCLQCTTIAPKQDWQATT